MEETESKDRGLVMAAGSGAAAGLLGTVVMTAFQRFVEMPLSGRRESYAPANFAERVLPIGVKRRNRRRLNYAAHFGIGVTWGVVHAVVVQRTPLRGQGAVGAVFAGIYGGDALLNVALGLYEPWEWSARDWAIDLGDKLLLAESVGLIHEQLIARAPSAAVA